LIFSSLTRFFSVFFVWVWFGFRLIKPNRTVFKILIGLIGFFSRFGFFGYFFSGFFGLIDFSIVLLTSIFGFALAAPNEIIGFLSFIFRFFSSFSPFFIFFHDVHEKNIKQR